MTVAVRIAIIFAGLVLVIAAALTAVLLWAPVQPPTVLAAAVTPTPTPGGYIVGYVFEDVSGNGTFDPGEPVIVGATVTAQLADDVRTTVTAANGWFGFYGVTAGMWTLAASCPGFSCADGQVMVADGKAYLTLAAYPLTATPTVAPTATATATRTPTATPTSIATPAPGEPRLALTPLPGLCGRLCVVGLPEAQCWYVCMGTSLQSYTTLEGR